MKLAVVRIFCLALLGACVFAFSASRAHAGKFVPVQSEDWPENGESDSSAKPTDSDPPDEASAPPAPRIPKMRMLPDGSPDPDSLKDFLQ